MPIKNEKPQVTNAKSRAAVLASTAPAAETKANASAPKAQSKKGGWAPSLPKIDLGAVFPDLKNDGKVVNLKTGKSQDFS